MPTAGVSKMVVRQSLATTARYLNPTTERLHQFIEEIEEKRQKAAAPSRSLQTEGKAEPELPEESSELNTIDWLA